MKALFCSLAALLLTVSPGYAHKAASGQDYSKYRQPNGMSCCNDEDCRPVDYSLGLDGKLLMYPGGRRIEVPRSLVNPLASEDGKGHWCGILSESGDVMTFCAILPQNMAGTPSKHPRRALARPAYEGPMLIKARFAPAGRAN